MQQTIITRTVKLHQIQADFRHSPAVIRGFTGGRGAGKSWVGAYDLLRRAEPGRFYFVGAPTYTVLEDATWRTLISLARDLEVFASATTAPRPKLRLWNGAEIIGRSAEDPERFRGPNLSGAWIDEASQVSRAAFDLLLPCLREGGQQGWVTGTFTPRGKSHWTYDVFATGRPGSALFRAATRENPFLPENFEGLIRENYTEKFAAQELSGEFIDAWDRIIPSAWLRHYSRSGEILQVLGQDGSKTGQAIDARGCSRFATIDTAGTSRDKADEARGKNPSWSVIAIWDYWRAADLLFLRHVWRDRAGWNELKLRAADVLGMWGVKKTLIENAHVGPPLISELTAFGAAPVGPTLPGMADGWRGAKLERAISAGLLSRLEQGRLLLPSDDPPWLEPYVDELTDWTGQPDDVADQIDVSSYGAWHCKTQAQPWGGTINGQNRPAARHSRYGF